jgi:hypothetical protein
MIRLIIFIYLSLATIALAQMMGLDGINNNRNANTSPVVGCSNKLDFTQACNSQYIGNL